MPRSVPRLLDSLAHSAGALLSQGFLRPAPQKHILYVFSRMAGPTVVYAAAGHSRRRRVGDLGHSGARCDASGRQEPPIADRGNRTVQLEKNGSVTYGESPFVRKMSSPRTFVSLQGRPSRSAL